MNDKPAGSQTSLFGAPGFTQLWAAQLISSFGDWIGLLAIIEIARQVGGNHPGSAIALVVTARVLPGFFLASAGGVIVDRVHRKRLMVGCDITRAATLLTLPFVNNLWGLVLASLVLELATSLWSPAKEAIVPNIVPPQHLASANSLGLVAAYGTAPLGALAFWGLAKLGGAIELFGTNIRTEQVDMALVIDSLTFLTAATLVATLPLERHVQRASRDGRRRIDFAQGIRELREGWGFIFYSPQVRAVLVGLGTGMLGGGMLVPLGAVFNADVLAAGQEQADSANFSTLLVGLGVGAAIGVLTVSLTQNRVHRAWTFVGSVFGAGGSLVVAASVSTTLLAVICVVVLGFFAGSSYVSGFTLLHESVDEELRGRVFSALYTMIRFCVLLALGIGGVLSDAFDWLFGVLFDNEVTVFGGVLTLPGVRGALWLGGLLILLAGTLAAASVRSLLRASPAHRAPHQQASSLRDVQR